MNRLLISLIPILLILSLSCSGGEGKKNSDRTKSNDTQENNVAEVDDARTEAVQAGVGKNQPPQIKSIRIARASESDPRAGFRVDVKAQDPDGDEVSLRYQWKKNDEDIVGAVEEVLPWQEDFKKGDYISVEIVPFDGEDEGIWRSEEGFTIPNSPPKIISQPEARMEGGKFTYQVKAEDPDGDQIEFALKNAPGGMTIEPATGLVTWEFGEKDIGEHRIEVIASDSEGAKDIQILTLNIPSEIP
jgi:hypothetical protein